MRMENIVHMQRLMMLGYGCCEVYGRRGNKIQNIKHWKGGQTFIISVNKL